MNFNRSGIKSRNILTPEGMIDGFLIFENDLIEDIVKVNEFTGFPEFPVTDFNELTVMPALTDTHVHINEPGRELWEGFETATKAAAAGGITALVDMPLNNSPVTIDKDFLDQKIKSSENKLFVDCGFYGGIVPGNTEQLTELIDSGVIGLKAFMIDSGLEDFPGVGENDLRYAFKKLRGLNIPVLVHAEKDCGYVNKNIYDKYSYNSFLNSRPREWENRAIEILIELSKEFDQKIHIVHLSSSDAIEMISNARSEGIKISVETCPHYLFFSSEMIADQKENKTLFKCTPPIREDENREKLWKAIKDGVIDFIVSDHSPCDPELKCLEEGNFDNAWGGISSLQLGLPVVWSECKKRGISLQKVSELMSTNTSDFIRPGKKKGKLRKGFQADFIIFDPDKKFVVDEKKLFHKHKYSPYNSRELFGSVESVYLRGRKIYENGEILSGPEGKIILNSNQ